MICKVKICLLIFSLITCLDTFSQTKTPLVEHFTNTRCPICASRNPGFYQLYEKYKDQVIHIAYHPSVPYSTCQFYQANTAGNGARQAYYNILGTPQAFLNGTQGSGTLPTENEYIAALSEPADFNINFKECSRENIEIEIICNKDFPDGFSFNFFCALTENLVNYAAPNGENVHHNVFRKFIPGANNGLPIQFNAGAKAGDNMIFSVGLIDYPGTWDIEDFSIVVFLQSSSSTEVLQTAKSAIHVPSSTLTIKDPDLILSPNPVKDVCTLSWDGMNIEVASVKLYDASGRENYPTDLNIQEKSLTFDVKNLSSGIYTIIIFDKKNNAIRSKKLIID